MIALLVAVAALPGLTAFERSLAWADRMSRLVPELPSGEWAQYGWDKPLDAYAAVVHKYGPSWQTTLGLGRIYASQGRLQLALDMFKRVPGHLTPGELALATEKARVAGLAQADMPRGLTLMDVIPLPGRLRNKWVVLCGKVAMETFRPGFSLPRYSAVELRVYAVFEGGARRVTLRKLGINDASGVMVRGVMLDVRRSPALIVDAQFPGGDAGPCSLDVFAVRGDKLPCVASFGGMLPFTAHRSPKDGRLVVACTPTWKVWWPDLYEWRGNRFVIANRRYPEFYSEEREGLPELFQEQGRSYPAFLHAAALSMIAGDRKAALRHLSKAEAICRGCLSPAKDGETHNFDAGFYGGTSENLREIRQRIAWIRRGDLNHLLLYRPYDWDLQVPPYKLGRAQEKVIR